MAVSSEEYWSIDGTSLHEYGWSVMTVGGSRYDLPTRRGDNTVLAYRPGTFHRAKVADSRVINLLMWMTGTNISTGNTVADPTLKWNDNWDVLRRLVWKPNGGQVLLTRRTWFTVDGVKTLVAADALAEIADTMEPTMTGRHRATFAMTLLLADPYFYGDEVGTNVYQGVEATVRNRGHDVAGHANVVIDFYGPLTDPVLTNITTDPNVWVKYSGYVPAGETLRLWLSTFQCYQRHTGDSGDGINQIAFLTHGGARTFMAFLPGNNHIYLTGGGGGGHVRIWHRPPYV